MSLYVNGANAGVAGQSQAGVLDREGTKVYIAGPMSGIEDFNATAFHRATHHLIKRGYEVFNPALDIQPDAGYRKWLRRDLDWICDHAEVMAMLPGWENSKGARVEWELARALGLRIIYLER